MAPSVEMTRAADQEREDHKMSRMRTVWNPWRDMNRLKVELDQLSNGNWWPHVRSGASFPAINALQNEQGLTLTAELPGIDASQLEVHVDKNSVTITGQRAAAPRRARNRTSAANAGSSRSAVPSSCPSTSTPTSAKPSMRRGC